MRKLLWLLPLVMFFTACQKETSFEAPAITNGTSSGTSVYTLGGAGSSCTGAIISGTYTNGIALSAANTVTINVIVTTIGTYSVSTTAVNGITFIGSGTFVTTGAQTITLIGSGTPTTVATSSIPITAGTSTCTFSVPVISAGPPATYTIAGAGSTCTGSAVSGTFTAGTVLTSSNTVTIQVNVTVLGRYNISTTAINGYSFSGAGTFATLGTQSIVLTGNGIPNAAGTDGFTAGTSGCTFNVIVGVSTSIGNGTDYITCKINGTAFTFNIKCYAVVSPDPYPGLAITGSSSSDITNTAVISLVSAKALGLQVSSITYTDVLSNGWAGTSTLNSANVINITSQTTTRASGTFSGTMKDNNGLGTNSKTVTEGKFSVPIQ